jgi:hypothetical protein
MLRAVYWILCFFDPPRISVRDPGIFFSGSRISDPGSNPYFLRLITILSFKNTYILFQLNQLLKIKYYFQFCEIFVAAKMQNLLIKVFLSFLSFLDLGSENRVLYLDPGPQKGNVEKYMFQKEKMISQVGLRFSHRGKFFKEVKNNVFPSFVNKNLDSSKSPNPDTKPLL